MQNTVFEFGGNVLRFDVFADIETPAAFTCIAFTTDILAFLVLFTVIGRLGGADRQITLVQFDLDIFFLEARQIDIQFIGFFQFTDIGFHQIFCIGAEYLRIACKGRNQRKGIIEHIIKQFFTKDTR